MMKFHQSRLESLFTFGRFLSAANWLCKMLTVSCLFSLQHWNFTLDGTEADVTDYCTAGWIKDVFCMLLNKKTNKLIPLILNKKDSYMPQLSYIVFCVVFSFSHCTFTWVCWLLFFCSSTFILRIPFNVTMWLLNGGSVRACQFSESMVTLGLSEWVDWF